MKRKVLMILLSVLLVLGLVPQTALAAGSPPSELSPPENLGVSDYMGSGVTCTISAPNDLRALLDLTDEERGYHMTLRGQIDFKIDGGNWHYTDAWDDPAAYTKYALNYYNSISGGEWKRYLGHSGIQFPSMFPDEKNAPPRDGFHSWDWYKSHSITFRARFAADFGNKNIVFSDWSQEYVLSDNVKMDYKKILNTYAPTLVSSRLKLDEKDNKPYIWIDMGRHPADTQKLNASAGNAMWTEIWMRKSGDTEFKLVGDASFGQERIKLNVDSYYKGSNITDFAAAAYEIKVRYKVDERAYKQSGVTAMNLLYSPYSNMLSYGMPAWNAASNWATPELKKADDAGLIPDILQGADLTKPITREEFCELALALYQKTTGDNAKPASPNPFTDTANPRILQAFALGITEGTSATTFEPKLLINREQCATMLFRTIKAINPDGDYGTAGVPDFPDQKDISSWAAQGTKYMSGLGIIKGDTKGNFMPKAGTTAQQAAGYGMATREAAILMSVRTYEVTDTDQ